MRLIPKNTKVRMQFYKGITFIDIILGLVILLAVALVVSSNLPYKLIIAFGLVCLSMPAFMSISGEKLYIGALYMARHLLSRKAYNGSAVQGLFAFEKIKACYIQNKDGSFTGVLEIKPIEFYLRSESRQDSLIDGVISAALNSIGAGQNAAIIKLDKPLNLDGQIKNELDRISELISAFEKGDLTEEEYTARLNIIEDRLVLIDRLNSEADISYSAYYFVIYDRDKRSLTDSLGNIQRLLSAGGIESDILEGKGLYEFIKLSIGSAPVPVEEPPKLVTPIEEPDIKEEYKLEGVIPKQVSFKLLNTLQDGKSLSSFVICGYPLKVANAWGAGLFAIPDTKVVMRLTPIEKSKAIRRIDNAMLELSSQNKNKASEIIDRSTHMETLSALLVGLQNDNESLFDVTLIITAYDDNGKHTVKKAVRHRLRELGFSYNELAGRQQDAYLTAGLSALNNINIARGIQSSSIAACFPFISSSVIDKQGVFLGENTLPVFVDFFKRDSGHVNSNMVIIGKPGSGKSYAAKTLITNLASCDTKIFILDPEGEYGRLAENLGGRVLDVSSAKHGRINPFHIITSLDDENEDGTRNSFFAHLQFLEEFFKQVLPGINADCMEVINRCVLEIYTDKGITGETDINKLASADYPIFEDLAVLVDKKSEQECDSYTLSCLKIIANYLSKFCSGGRNSALWNGPSTFGAKENFVSFDFQKLLANKNNAVANAQMLLVLKWLENEVIRNREYNLINDADRKIVIVIDEAHTFIDEKYPIALDFMFQLAKRIRKYNGMQIVITQNIKDFAGTAETARKSMAIINVSQYSLIFSLSPDDMTDLCVLYEKAGRINETEQDCIVHNPRGRAFLISNPESRTNIDIVATPYIESIFKTDNNN